MEKLFRNDSNQYSLVEVHLSENQASLEHDHPRVEETHRVGPRVLEGVVPERVDDRPRKIITVVPKRKEWNVYRSMLYFSLGR